MTLNLDKNKTLLVQGWKDVVDERKSINWALFGYDGQTYDLNLVSEGDGGLEELAEEFNSGKVQYGLCRVQVKEKNVEKIALIHWQGEGAPLVRKGMSANHVDTIRAFFKGVHVTLNARTEDEVEPEFIVKMVGKAVAGEGMKMSSSIDEEYITPVGAIYKKVNAQEEINAKAKDEFWRKDMAEEERRRREEVTRQRKFSQDEVRFLRKESQEYFDKEEEQLAEEKHQANVERMKKTSPLPKVNGTTINGGKSPINATSPVPPVMTTNTAERTAALHASTPMKSTTNSDLVRKRIKSFDGGSGPVFPGKVNGVGGGGGGGGTQVRKFSSPVSPSVRSPSPPKNGEQKQEKMALPSVQKRKQMFEGGSPSSANTATRRNPAEEIRLAQEEAKKQQEKEKEKEKSIKVAQKIKQEEPEERTVVSPTAHYQAPVVESPAPVKQQPAFFNNPTSTVTKSPSPEPAPVPVVAKAPSPMPAKSPEPRKIDSPVPAPPQFANNTNGASPTPVVEGETITINITPEMGTCARALYDYQAADETEVTFDPGEIISNIEKIDEGWWEGLAPNGQFGLFPANYVELLN